MNVRTREIQLTSDGLGLIQQRLAVIREQRLPELRPYLYGPERDEALVAQFEALLEELTGWEAVLGQARILPEATSATIVLGSRVRVRLSDGGDAWVRPVHPVEAALDDERISVDSPLGSSILGCQVGDRVEVNAPIGSWTAEVLEIAGVGKRGRRRK